MSPHFKLSNKSGFVYFAERIGADGNPDGWLKYGMSMNPYNRMKQLSRIERCSVRIISFSQSLNARSCEALLACMAKSLAEDTRGEYFKVSQEGRELFEEAFEQISKAERLIIRKGLGLNALL